MSDEGRLVAVLVDDELHNMMWMADWLESLELDLQLAREASEAIEIIDEDRYRFLILDLNIPILDVHEAAAAALGPIYLKYPGLYVARHARSKGYRDRQVILYTVHKDLGVAAEAEKLGCTYILKGRPQELKREIEAVLSFDPTTSHKTGQSLPLE